MNIKKKLALLSASGVLGLSLIAGGATYAIFTSSAQNTNNSFSSGTISITAKKDDVPNNGPMFYTKSPDNGVVLGGMPTGYWAPGDKNTRGLFLENTGTLDARLKTLSIFPTNSSAVEVSSGDDYDNALLFARQSKVIVWNVKKIDVDGTAGPIKAVNATFMDTIMNYINFGYSQWRNDHPAASLEDQQTAADLMNYTNSYLISQMNNLPSDGTDSSGRFEVKNIYEADLSSMVNNQINFKAENIKIAKDEAALLGFTVEFLKDPPAGSGINPNDMQGKSVYFTFKTDWEQDKNNP
ncbi:TasA family protein [Neobacillus sp. SAB-20_R2A]|uniref:TasA family protein n=1 Tax=Neobacillus sp. SAB-20_R2A TaxID=3120519 RepID=UPI003C6DBFAE